MGWSTDPYESFRIFQGKILAEYEAMIEPFDFTVIDATAAKSTSSRPKSAS